MTLRELLLDHLEHTFEKEAWQPSLAMAIEGLTAAQAAWKPAPDRHSIWQIVRHVTHWKQTVLAALAGHPVDLEAHDGADWQQVSGDEAAWQADIRALHDVSVALKERAEAADDDALSGLVATYKGGATRPLAQRLVRAATHDIYHAGQIQYLRALQGI